MSDDDDGTIWYSMKLLKAAKRNKSDSRIIANIEEEIERRTLSLHKLLLADSVIPFKGKFENFPLMKRFLAPPLKSKNVDIPDE